MPQPATASVDAGALSSPEVEARVLAARSQIVEARDAGRDAVAHRAHPVFAAVGGAAAAACDVGAGRAERIGAHTGSAATRGGMAAPAFE